MELSNQIHDREVHGYGKYRYLYHRSSDEYLGDNPDLCNTNVQQAVRQHVAVKARRMADAILNYMPDSKERTAAIKHIGTAMMSLQKALDKPEGCCDYCWLERG